MATARQEEASTGAMATVAGDIWIHGWSTYINLPHPNLSPSNVVVQLIDGLIKGNQWPS